MGVCVCMHACKRVCIDRHGHEQVEAGSNGFGQVEAVLRQHRQRQPGQPCACACACACVRAHTHTSSTAATATAPIWSKSQWTCRHATPCVVCGHARTSAHCMSTLLRCFTAAASGIASLVLISLIPRTRPSLSNSREVRLGKLVACGRGFWLAGRPCKCTFVLCNARNTDKRACLCL